MSPELLQEIRRLIAQGKTVEAIKRFREVTGSSLKDSKEAVEALRRGEEVPGLDRSDAPAARGLDPTALEEISRLAQAGELVAAIKALRAATTLGLKDAKEAVEALQRGEPVPQLSLELAPSLPARCSNCGAAVSRSSIKWVSAVLAECLFCGTDLRAGGRNG